MSTKVYLSASDVSSLLGVSAGFAYRIIREMNHDLRQKGYLAISGKVPTRYFEEKWYGMREAADNKNERMVK